MRLEALDGIRGLAALFVVFFHIGFAVKPIAVTLSAPWRLLIRISEHGHDAVVTFIVLSGFVLMLPVARSKDGLLPNGFGDYVRRRARRIMPAYYSALILSLLLAAAWSLCIERSRHGSSTEVANPFGQDTTFWAVVSHIFLFQNLTRPWSIAIDSPMWSVATEWQIYFIFPLILLPVWRKFGCAAAIAMGFVVGMIPVMLLPHDTNFDSACPWFVGIFALGMAAAALSVQNEDFVLLKKPGSWGIAAVGMMLAIGFTQARLPHIWLNMGLWTKDFFLASGVALFLVYIARSQIGNTGRPPLVARVLGAPVLVWLGGFSYSLYLVHHPVNDFIQAMLPRHLTGQQHIIAMLALGIPCSLICAYGFSLLFEKPRLIDFLGSLVHRHVHSPADASDASHATPRNAVASLS